MCLSLFGIGRGTLASWRDSRRRWKGSLNVSRRSYPVTTAFSSLNPGICGVGPYRINKKGQHQLFKLSERTQ